MLVGPVFQIVRRSRLRESSEDTTNPADNVLSFEDAYTQLEQTVRTLEEGGMPLDETTRLFEEGMRLAHICQQHLNTAELKITHLQQSFGEQIEFGTNASHNSDAEI
jgi:exodeoxyribonuclease VII small subunit